MRAYHINEEKRSEITKTTLNEYERTAREKKMCITLKYTQTESICIYYEQQSTAHTACVGNMPHLFGWFDVKTWCGFSYIYILRRIAALKLECLLFFWCVCVCIGIFCVYFLLSSIFVCYLSITLNIFIYLSCVDFVGVFLCVCIIFFLLLSSFVYRSFILSHFIFFFLNVNTLRVFFALLFVFFSLANRETALNNTNKTR